MLFFILFQVSDAVWSTCTDCSTVCHEFWVQ